MFQFEANKVELTLLEESLEILTSGARNVFFCQFSFDESWAQFTTRKAVFRTDIERRIVDLDENGQCKIPQEVLSIPGKYVYAGVLGSRDGETDLPTVMVNMGYVHEGAGLGQESEPTPSIYTQLMNKIQQAMDLAQGVRDDADAGLFGGSIPVFDLAGDFGLPNIVTDGIPIGIDGTGSGYPGPELVAALAKGPVWLKFTLDGEPVTALTQALYRPEDSVYLCLIDYEHNGPAVVMMEVSAPNGGLTVQAAAVDASTGTNLTSYIETGGVGRQQNPADADNGVWTRDNGRLAFGMTPNTAPVPFEIGGQLLANGTIIARNTFDKKYNRHNYHVFEAYAKDNYSRLTVVVDKHQEEAGGKPSAEIYYYVGANHYASSYGNTKIGSDVALHSFSFDRDKMTAYGEIEAHMPITLARISLENDVDDTYDTVHDVDVAYEPETYPEENARCLRYIALQTAKDGAMYYDTDKNRVMVKVNGAWSEFLTSLDTITVEWESGVFNQRGEEVANTARIRTSGYIPAGVAITANAGYEFGVLFLDDNHRNNPYAYYDSGTGTLVNGAVYYTELDLAGVSFEGYPNIALIARRTDLATMTAAEGANIILDSHSVKYATKEYVDQNKLPIPETASAGQILKVASVDESGKVTAVVAEDMPTGGDGSGSSGPVRWYHIADKPIGFQYGEKLWDASEWTNWENLGEGFPDGAKYQVISGSMSEGELYNVYSDNMEYDDIHTVKKMTYEDTEYVYIGNPALIFPDMPDNWLSFAFCSVLDASTIYVAVKDGFEVGMGLYSVDYVRQLDPAYVDAEAIADQAAANLPIATNATKGVVKPVAKTTEMVQSVGVDQDGRLFTKPAEGGSGSWNDVGVAYVKGDLMYEATMIQPEGMPYTIAEVVDESIDPNVGADIFLPGQAYVVSFDGVESVRSCDKNWVIGNGYLYGSSLPDTGEDYFVTQIAANGFLVVNFSLATNFKIYACTITKKLDPAFILGGVLGKNEEIYQIARGASTLSDISFSSSAEDGLNESEV